MRVARLVRLGIIIRRSSSPPSAAHTRQAPSTREHVLSWYPPAENNAPPVTHFARARPSPNIRLFQNAKNVLIRLASLAVSNVGLLMLPVQPPLVSRPPFDTITPRTIFSCSCSIGRKNVPDDPPRVNDAWDPAEDGQEDIDQQVGVAATLEEHAKLGGCKVSKSIVTSCNCAGRGGKVVAVHVRVLTGGTKKAMK